MQTFFAELKRRHIYRVAAAYAVVAWVLLQLVNNLTPALNLPNWAGTLVVALLALGFPIALLFCWIQQLASSDGARATVSTNKLDWCLAGMLGVVIALVSYQQFAPTNRARTAPQQASVPSGAPSPRLLSIAVLPFANDSGDAGQEFFSDGMTDEIIAALAKVPSLQVVARTSAFQFKGEKKDMRAIGQALSARYLIDGSVRKAGNRVRITAQLVQADNGVGVWTNSYDREIHDIFATQENIAQAIAGALRVPLGLQQGETLVSNRTGDTESYQDYLRAKTLVRARGVGNSLADATALLEQGVARDPGYAPAWALLAQAYALAPSFAASLNFFVSGGSTDAFRRVADTSLTKAEAAARRAIELDARNSDAYTALADARAFRGKFLESEDLFKQALALDPGNPDALNAYSRSLAELGRVKEAVAMRQQLRSLEPFVPVFNHITERYLWVNGQHEAALAIANALPSDYPLRTSELAWIYASTGRYKEAADVLLTTPAGIYSPGLIEAVAQLLRKAPAPAPRQDMPYLGYLSFVYLYVGAPERSLEQAELYAEAGYLVMIVNASLWHSSYAPVRKTERFKTLMRKAGMVEYWRAKGWPDLCHPVGADDFACE
jgi:TolB-like protein